MKLQKRQKLLSSYVRMCLLVEWCVTVLLRIIGSIDNDHCSLPLCNKFRYFGYGIADFPANYTNCLYNVFIVLCTVILFTHTVCVLMKFTHVSVVNI